MTGNHGLSSEVKYRLFTPSLCPEGEVPPLSNASGVGAPGCTLASIVTSGLAERTVAKTSGRKAAQIESKAEVVFFEYIIERLRFKKAQRVDVDRAEGH